MSCTCTSQTGSHHSKAFVLFSPLPIYPNLEAVNEFQDALSVPDFTPAACTIKPYVALIY
jgi:hypothetical protein